MDVTLRCVHIPTKKLPAKRGVTLKSTGRYGTTLSATTRMTMGTGRPPTTRPHIHRLETAVTALFGSLSTRPQQIVSEIPKTVETQEGREETHQNSRWHSEPTLILIAPGMPVYAFRCNFEYHKGTHSPNS